MISWLKKLFRSVVEDVTAAWPLARIELDARIFRVGDFLVAVGAQEYLERGRWQTPEQIAWEDALNGRRWVPSLRHSVGSLASERRLSANVLVTNALLQSAILGRPIDMVGYEDDRPTVYTGFEPLYCRPAS